MDVSAKDVKDLSKLVTKKLHHYVNYYRRAERFDSSGKGYYRTTQQMLPYDQQYRLYEIVELEKQEKKRKSHNSGIINLKLIKNSRRVMLNSEVARLQSTANTVLKSTPVRDLQSIHRYRPQSLSDDAGYLPIIPCHVGSILRSQSCMDYYLKENVQWAKKRTATSTRAQQESNQVANHEASLKRKKLHKLKFLNDTDIVRQSSPVTTSEATVEDMWTINIVEDKRKSSAPSTKSADRQKVNKTGDIDDSNETNEGKIPPKTFLTTVDYEGSSDDGYISPATERQESSTPLHSTSHSPSSDGSESSDYGSTFSSASNEKKVETFVTSIIDAAGTDVFTELYDRKETVLGVNDDESTFSSASNEKNADIQMETFISSIIDAAWSDVISEFHGRKDESDDKEQNKDRPEREIQKRSDTPSEREIQKRPDTPLEREIQKGPDTTSEREIQKRPDTPLEREIQKGPNTPLEREIQKGPDTTSEREIQKGPDTPSERQIQKRPDTPSEREIEKGPDTPSEREIQTTASASMTRSLNSLSSSSSDDSSSTYSSSSSSSTGENQQTAARAELDGKDVQCFDGETEAGQSLPRSTSFRRLSETSLSSTSSDNTDSSGSFHSYYVASSEQLENKVGNQNVETEKSVGSAVGTDNTSADLEDTSKKLTTAVQVEEMVTLEQKNNVEKMTKSDVDEEIRSSSTLAKSPSAKDLESYSTVYHMSKTLTH